MCDQRGEMIFCSHCRTETEHYNGHCGECFAENKSKAPEDPNTEIVAEIFGLELTESEESREVVQGTIAEALTECADDLHSIGLMDDETRERVRELCTPSEEPKLLPCPFCGEVPELKEEPPRYTVHCTNPGCGVRIETYWCAFPERAVKLWNTRHK